MSFIHRINRARTQDTLGAQKIKLLEDNKKLYLHNKTLLNALQSCAQVLRQYADEGNWVDKEDGAIWLGAGNGPQLAQKVLGPKTPEHIPPQKASGIIKV